jgi:hypothetical protein
MKITKRCARHRQLLQKSYHPSWHLIKSNPNLKIQTSCSGNKTPSTSNTSTLPSHRSNSHYTIPSPDTKDPQPSYTPRKTHDRPTHSRCTLLITPKLYPLLNRALESPESVQSEYANFKSCMSRDAGGCN